MYTEDEDYEQEEYTSKKVKSRKKSFSFKKVVLFIIVLILIGAIAFFAIKYIEKKNENYVLEIIPNEISVPIGESIDLSVKVFDDDKNEVLNPEISWQSSDTSIAIIENNTIKGINYGKVTITAKYVSKLNNEYTVTKDVYVYSGDYSTTLNNISIGDGDLYLPVGANYNIVLKPEPTNGRIDGISYISSDNSVASVDGNGLIAGIKEGEATISIDVNNGTIDKNLKVIVTNSVDIPKFKIIPQSVSIDRSINKISVGESKRLSYVVNPTNADDDFVWISSNSDIISVDSNGIIKGLKKGYAQITIYSSSLNDIADSADIEVEIPFVEDNPISTTLPNSDILVDANALNVNMTLKVGQSFIISSNFYPSSELTKQFDYYNSNKSIASLSKSSNGVGAVIQGLAVGKTTVIVRANDAVIKIINITVTNANIINSDTCSSSPRVNCPNGEYSVCGKCEICPVGSFCNNGGKVSCPAGTDSKAGAKSYSECTKCNIGTYSTGNAKECVACPYGKTTLTTGAKSEKECVANASSNSVNTIVCEKGEYILNGKCEICPVDSYCPNGNVKVSCPSGKSSSVGAKDYNECK